MSIIFSIDRISTKVIFGNNRCKEFFHLDTISYEYSKGSLLDNLIHEGLEKVSILNYGKVLLNYENKDYFFNVEELEFNQILFSECTNNMNHQSCLKLLADNLPGMLWAKDLEGKYLYANKALCNKLLLAKDTDEPIGKDDLFFVLREKDKFPKDKQWHTFWDMNFNSDKEVLKNMKCMVFEESGNVQGKNIILEMYKAPLRDEKGSVIGIIGSGRDITHEAQIIRDLHDKTELLIQQSKMAQLGEILESITHQWRHPLSLIAMVVTTAIVQKSENLEVDMDYVFSNVLEATQHLSITIDDFRDFFKQDNEKSDFFLNKAFKQALGLFKVKFKVNGIKVITSCEEFELYGYRRKLIQVVMNLLSNSNDALEEFVEDEEKRFIFVNIYKENDRGIVKIKDNGMGIQEDIIEKVFHARFTTKSAKDGTGIGLYMTKEIVEKHMNGTISVENSIFKYERNIYKGAEFTISLPLK